MPHRHRNGKLNWVVVGAFIASWLIVLGSAAFYALAANEQRTDICEVTNENRDLIRAILTDGRKQVAMLPPSVRSPGALEFYDRQLERVPATVRC